MADHGPRTGTMTFPSLQRPVTLALLLMALPALAQPATALPERMAKARFSRMPAGPVAAPWRVVGLPDQKMPLTRFDIQSLDGDTALRVRADASYGNLVIDTQSTPLAAPTRLQWRWQLARGLAASDLHRKDGDDVPVKVCALFDMALDGMSFGEQARLRLARALTGEPLPSATLCYVWDRLLPVGQALPNVFSPRVRYLVVSTGPAQPGIWQTIERRLDQDFLLAFGHESRTMPPLIALAVGADADNTGGSSLAWVGDLLLAVP